MIRSLAIIVCALVAGSQANCNGYPQGSTMCLPARNCGSNEICQVSAADKQTILNVHNMLRNRVASGSETRGSPGPQPSALNMVELQWDNELAMFAQRWAEQLMWRHDCRTCRATNKFSSVGQNLALDGSTRRFTEGNWTKAITGWYDEVVDMDGTNLADYDYSVVGHYTQAIWASTTHVGCGMYAPGAKCASIGWPSYHCVIFACNYGPAGNCGGVPPYAEPCSSMSSSFSSLCSP